ncbi:MAG: phosphodiester glycosidase family protein [Ruminococcus sp.]|nr:phosphodiester glycosidase family protein [Ruminococcus sp.]
MRDKNIKHKYLFAAVYSLVVAAFTAYVMLDTFVLEQVEQADATAQNTSMFDGLEVKKLSLDEDESSSADNESSSENDDSSNTEQGSSRRGASSKRSRHSSSSQQAQGSSETDNDSSDDKNDDSTASEQTGQAQNLGSYSDENIAVTVNEYYENDTSIYVADIRLSSAQYLKTAFANGSFGKNVKAATSDTAEENNAIIAINGDYYGAREKGYVIRNGIAYRSTAESDSEILCIYADGHFDIISPSEASADELVEMGVWQAFTFGPGLVDGGEIAVSEGQEVDQAMASNPRTAIGQIDELHYVFVVSDGRTNESAGLSLYQLAQFMKGLGCESAYNLDGGGSSTMYFDGEVINNPTTSGNSTKERRVSDIVYLGY